MEGAADAQRQGALRSCGFQRLAGARHGFLLARDDHLPVAVVVGRDHDAVDAGTDLLDLLVRQGDDGCHPAGHLLAAFLHFAGAHGHEAQRILEVHGAGCHEGGELAQGVAADHVGGGEPFGAEGGCDGVEEDGWLGHARGAQVLVGAFEHDVGQAETEDFVGPLHQGASLGVAFIEVLAHSGELGPLAGEYVCSFHNTV